jgi:signal peptidase I
MTALAHHHLSIRATLAVALTAVAVVGLRAQVIEPVRVASASMAPTLEQGDVVVVNKLDREPVRGDLITLRSPQDGERVLKRVVGVGGDVVAIKDAILYVNDVVVDEPYVDHESIDALYYGPFTVTMGSVLVMGDARADSIDSRTYGDVSLQDVTGTVVGQLWPPAPTRDDGETSHPSQVNPGGHRDPMP